MKTDKSSLHIEYHNGTNSVNIVYRKFNILELKTPVPVIYSMCPRSSDQFFMVTYYEIWVTTSWTYSILGILIAG